MIEQRQTPQKLWVGREGLESAHPPLQYVLYNEVYKQEEDGGVFTPPAVGIQCGFVLDVFLVLCFL